MWNCNAINLYKQFVCEILSRIIMKCVGVQLPLSRIESTVQTERQVEKLNSFLWVSAKKRSTAIYEGRFEGLSTSSSLESIFPENIDGVKEVEEKEECDIRMAMFCSACAYATCVNYVKGDPWILVFRLFI